MVAGTTENHEVKDEVVSGFLLFLELTSLWFRSATIPFRTNPFLLLDEGNLSNQTQGIYLIGDQQGEKLDFG